MAKGLAAAQDSQIPRRSIYGKSRLSASIAKKNKKSSSSTVIENTTTANDKTTKAGSSIVGKMAAKAVPVVGQATTAYDAVAIPNTLMSRTAKSMNTRSERTAKKKQAAELHKARTGGGRSAKAQRTYQTSMSRQPKDPGV